MAICYWTGKICLGGAAMTLGVAAMTLGVAVAGLGWALVWIVGPFPALEAVTWADVGHGTTCLGAVAAMIWVIWWGMSAFVTLAEPPSGKGWHTIQ
jgi:hypothetical protein